MDKVTRQIVIDKTVQELMPEDIQPFPAQISTAKRHIGHAIDALSVETFHEMRRQMDAPIMEGEMTPQQFRQLGDCWKPRELASLMGLSLATIYLYRKDCKGGLKVIPKKAARNIIALRKSYDEKHNVTEDPILDSVLQAMGLK